MRDIAKRIVKLEGQQPALPRLLLVTYGAGRFSAMGTGQSYTQAEVDALEADGTAQVVVLEVVYDVRGGGDGQERTADE